MMKEESLRDRSRTLSAAAASDAIAGVMEPPVETVTPSPQRTVRTAQRRQRGQAQAPVRHFAAVATDDSMTNRQAELFYLQKQIQLRTQMVFVLEDGSRVQGVVEWYDRNCIKVQGRSRTLIYKAAIKYLYKAGEIGTAPSLG